MSLHGILKASIYDPATGTTVQLNKLVGSSVFRTGPMDGEEKDPRGAPYYAGDESFAELVSRDGSSAETQLRTWNGNNTDVSMVAICQGYTIQWTERDLVQLLKDEVRGALGGSRGFGVRMMRKGHGGHQIGTRVNASLPPAEEWLEGETEGLASGWQVEEADDKAFADGEQSITSTANETTRFYKDIEFPIEGVEVKFSIEVVDADADLDIVVEQLDFEGVVLESDSVSGATTGRKTITTTTVAGIYSLRLVGAEVAAASSKEVIVKEPALRIDGSSAFTTA